MSTPGNCWEQCFQSLATDANRGVLQEIYKSGNIIKRAKDIESIDSLAFLLDSTLNSFCDIFDSKSSSREEYDYRMNNENSTAIWKMQLQMMAIISVMVGGDTTIFPIQFNENAAWGCRDYSCLSVCQTFALVNGNYLTPLQTNLTACKDGLLEPACRVSYHIMNSYSCNVNNTMAVSILNSDVHSHVHKRSVYRDYSPCHTFFDYRFALGLHKAHIDDLQRFQSRDEDHNFMGDSLLYQTIVNSVFTCMNTKCCTPASTISSLTNSCDVAYGDAGETLSTVAAINPTVG